MNILIYIPELSKASGGTYQYSFGVFNIIKNIEDFSYYVFVQKSFSELDKFVDANKNFNIIPKNECNLKTKQEQLIFTFKRVTNKFLNYLGLKFRLKAYKHIENIIKKYNINIIYSPHQNIPESNIPMIVTTHDVQQLHFPHYFSIKERIQRAISFKLTNTDATKIIVSYEHIKNDIINLYKRNPDDIHVLLLSMNNLWFKDFKQANITKLEKYNLPDKFLLYPAATWEHKNHIRLIQAVAKLRKENINVNIVCTGNQTPFFSKIKNQLKKHNVQNLFHFLGIVENDVLHSLYKTTRATIVPTIYEAGSFPLMESILLETPVICSNVTSLPETIGDERFIFDPFDTDEIAEKIKLIYLDNSFWNDNKNHLNKMHERLVNTNFRSKFEAIVSLIQST